MWRRSRLIFPSGQISFLVPLTDDNWFNGGKHCNNVPRALASSRGATNGALNAINEKSRYENCGHWLWTLESHFAFFLLYLFVPFAPLIDDINLQFAIFGEGKSFVSLSCCHYARDALADKSVKRIIERYCLVRETYLISQCSLAPIKTFLQIILFS